MNEITVGWTTTGRVVHIIEDDEKLCGKKGRITSTDFVSDLDEIKDHWIMQLCQTCRGEYSPPDEETSFNQCRDCGSRVIGDGPLCYTCQHRSKVIA